MAKEDTVLQDIEKTISEIKKLTQQVIKTCAPKEEREQELVAICNQITTELERSKIRLQNNSDDYQAVLDKQRTRCFIEFNKVIGMERGYVEHLYINFVVR